MTPTLGLVHLVAASKSSSSSSLLTLLPLLLIGVAGYFFFIRPQQKKAQAARQAQGSGIEVGDEVQTVGGVIGTVLEIHGERYTVLTGALGDDGNLDGPQPTRIVFVRQAIARKIERIDATDVQDVDVDDDTDADEETPGANGRTNGTARGSGAGTNGRTNGSTEDIDDVGGGSATGGGDRSGGPEEV
jgi:preprotein translocase subunit YajC